MSANFYLLKVEGIRIGDSEPAPLLTLIVGPSEESREAGKKIEIGGYRDDDKWPEVHEAMSDAMCKLEKSLKPHISKSFKHFF